MQITITWDTVVTERRVIVLEGEDIPDFLGSALDAGYDLDLDAALIDNAYRGVSEDEIDTIRRHLRDHLADLEDQPGGPATQPRMSDVFSRELVKIETVR